MNKLNKSLRSQGIILTLKAKPGWVGMLNYEESFSLPCLATTALTPSKCFSYP